MLDLSTFKAFADNKIKVLKMMSILFYRVEDIERKGENAVVGKGENVDYQHFLLFSQCLQMSSRGFLLIIVKSRDCMVKSSLICVVEVIFVL